MKATCTSISIYIPVFLQPVLKNTHRNTFLIAKCSLSHSTVRKPGNYVSIRPSPPMVSSEQEQFSLASDLPYQFPALLLSCPSYSSTIRKDPLHGLCR